MPPSPFVWTDPVVVGQNAGTDLIAVLPAFVVAVLLISASPGPAMALILQRATVSGWRRAVPTILGLEFGICFPPGAGRG